jgi:hypothetical protein
MAKHSASWPTLDGARPAPFGTDDLTCAIRAELSALAAIDSEYAQRQLRLETWAGPQAAKERLAREVEACHRRDREPHVLRLGALHERVMALTMFKGLRTKH